MEEIYTEAASIELEDGEYMITVDMEGGSGKASIQSPCALKVEDHQGTATIVWSSSHYDYMIVNGEKILPVETPEENSTFEIPVYVYDEPMEVIGDTTAMSTPHEISYSLTFHSDQVESASGSSGSGLGFTGIIALVAAFVIGFAAVSLFKKRGTK